MNQIILTIEDDLAFNPQFSGGKGANLAQLIKAGFNVPPFFTLSARLYQHIIQLNRIDRVIDKATLEKSLENFQQIKSAILAVEMPEFIISQITNAFQNSAFQTVAVRSSALAEDLSDHSFAGQLESYLDIRDEKQLLESIKKCWASLWNERVYHYISTSWGKFRPQPIAVIVQQMIPAEYAGICFTLDPTDTKQQWMMIEAHPGIGEEIVGGKINPIRHRVHRQNLKIKDEQTIIDRQKIIELAQTCLKIEQYFDAPQDIEWAFYQGQSYILQSRPITTVARKPASSSEKLWSNYFLGERFPQPVSPLGWSVLKPLIEKNAFREPLNFLGFHGLARSHITKSFYGRPYTKLEVFQALHSLFPTAYVSSDKRKLFYEDSVSVRQSIVKIFKNIFPILKSILSTTDWIPPIHLRNWTRFLNDYLEKMQPVNKLDWQTQSDEQLWQVNVRADQLTDRLLKLHRWSITFAELIYHFLMYLIRKWLPQMDAEQTVIELHRGIPGNKTIEMNIELWYLSRNYRFHSSERWNRFLTFIQKFGHRSTSLDISVPTFAEDTNYILELIQRYLSLSPEMSPEIKQKKFEQQRQECFQVVCQNLSKQSLGFLKKVFFKILLNWSEQFILLRENQRYYWHQILAINRNIFLKLGKRFFDRGWLEKKPHIFFLKRNEIKSIIFSKEFFSTTELAKRLQQHSQWQKITPPALIDESNPFQTDNGIIGKKLAGIGASPGMVTGKARVLTSFQEMPQLQAGEILIVPTTDPGWTPLFGVIKGLVMEVGGVLSHGSIVAREFGIPAVTSVSQATSIINSGVQITVDGNKGMIWINESKLK